MMIIYLTGVAINLITLIKAFSDDNFINIIEENFNLNNKSKVIILVSCSLSWLIPLYLIFRKR